MRNGQVTRCDSWLKAEITYFLFLDYLFACQEKANFDLSG